MRNTSKGWDVRCDAVPVTSKCALSAMERIAALEAHIADLEARFSRLESSQQTRAVGIPTYPSSGYGSAGIIGASSVGTVVSSPTSAGSIVGAPPIHTSFIDAR